MSRKEEQVKKERKQKTIIAVLSILAVIILLIIAIAASIKPSGKDDNTKQNEESFSSESTEQEESQEENEDMSGYIEYDKEMLYFDDPDIRWGMSAEEFSDIKHFYKAYKDYPNASGDLVYHYYSDYFHKTNTYNLDEEQYWFYSKTDKLNSYMLKFKDDGGTYENYNNILSVLSEKYGNPSSRNENFNDETYRNDPEKALKYGYLDIKTTWTNLPNFDILIQWNKGMYTITYCQKGYPGNW